MEEREVNKRPKRNFLAELSGAEKESFPEDPAAPKFDQVEIEGEDPSKTNRSDADSVGYKEEFTMKVESKSE